MKIRPQFRERSLQHMLELYKTDLKSTVQITGEHTYYKIYNLNADNYRGKSASFSGICPCLLWLFMSPWVGKHCYRAWAV